MGTTVQSILDIKQGQGYTRQEQQNGCAWELQKILSLRQFGSIFFGECKTADGVNPKHRRSVQVRGGSRIYRWGSDPIGEERRPWMWVLFDEKIYGNQRIGCGSIILTDVLRISTSMVN